MSKQDQIASWIKKLRNSTSKVMVCSYSYDCFFTGNCKTKTIIVIPDELDSRGVISLDKPIDEIEMIDIIKLHARIGCN